MFNNDYYSVTIDRISCEHLKVPHEAQNILENPEILVFGMVVSQVSQDRKMTFDQNFDYLQVAGAHITHPGSVFSIKMCLIMIFTRLLLIE